MPEIDMSAVDSKRTRGIRTKCTTQRHAMKTRNKKMTEEESWNLKVEKTKAYKKNRRSAQDLLDWIFELLKEYQDTQVVVHSFSCADAGGSISNWSPPFPGTFKLNTDAAVFSNLNSLELELLLVLALREGLVLAKQLGFQISWAEVDTANVAAAVNLLKPSSGLAGFVFDDVRALFKEAGISKCQAISRKGNGLAHNLASLAISSRKEQLWQRNCSISVT
ncbi:hypothetical protein Q3G72_003470 [Acer saccharum]|nr:hypothetical protein Q3G72_003470 [Acer saccharum]